MVLYGGWIRFRDLSRESLWIDELWTWQIADQTTLSDVVWHSRLRNDVHPPLHFVMHYYLQKLVGDSERVLRAPSALAGVLTIVAMFLLGRRLYTDVEGLIAAGLTAVLAFPIRYSQEARSYMMVALFVVLAAWYWVRVMERLCARKRPARTALAGYIVTATIAACLHYYGLFIIGLQGMAAAALLAWRRPKALLFQPLFYVPVVVHYLWWWPVMRRSLRITQFWIKPPKNDAFFSYIREMLNYTDWIAWTAIGVFAWVVVAATYRTIILRKRRSAPDADGSVDDDERLPFRELLLVCWLVVPFAIVFVKSLVSQPILTNKNLIISMPAVYLLVARGVTLVPVRRWVQLIIGMLMVVGLALHFFWGYAFYQHRFNDMFRQAAAMVVSKKAKREETLIVGYSFGGRFWDYYFDRMGAPERVDLFAGDARDIARLREAVVKRRPKFIWVLWGHRLPGPRAQQLLVGYVCQEYAYYHWKKAFLRVTVLLFVREDVAQMWFGTGTSWRGKALPLRRPQQ